VTATVLPADLRSGANEKLRRGYELREDLHQKMYAGWWDKRPVSLATELRDETFIELVMLVRSMPKVKEWWAQASDVFQNFRSALDRFHYAVCQHFAPPGWEARVYFPITKDSKGWTEWTKQHGMIPREIQQRYLAFQPWYSGRSFLSDLNRIVNLEKHSTGVAATISMKALETSGTWRVEGLWKDDNLGDHVELTAGETLDIKAERQVLGAIKLPTRILDLGDFAVAPSFTFEPVIRFDKQEIPMLAGIQVIGQEVTWAIAHITGLIESATEPPKQISL
jgi:hypothetical protein